MLTKEINDIFMDSEIHGWVLEPDAKRLLSNAGVEVPRFIWTDDPYEGIRFSNEIGYPVVAKIVSPEVLHKTEIGGVIAGINDDEALKNAFQRFCTIKGFTGVLVEESLSGIELILGAKIDYQFGPVILMGIGGTAVEIYNDMTMRMAPIEKKDVLSMVQGLQARKLLEGFRGTHPVNIPELTRMMVTFSKFAVEFEGYIDTIDLNPVICSSDRCVVADARIILKSEAL